MKVVFVRFSTSEKLYLIEESHTKLVEEHVGVVSKKCSILNKEMNNSFIFLSKNELLEQIKREKKFIRKAVKKNYG